jgi:hypothetical protein
MPQLLCQVRGHSHAQNFLDDAQLLSARERLPGARQWRRGICSFSIRGIPKPVEDLDEPDQGQDQDGNHHQDEH